MSTGASDVLLRLLGRAGARRYASPPAAGRMSVEEVEPRILHSADLAPFVAGAAAAPQAEIRVLDAVPANGPSTAQHATRHELVVVDAATPDYQKLVDDIVAHADPSRVIDVLVVERGSDGLKQIGDALAGRTDVDALHIISHGSAGAIYLGRDTLDAAALAANPDDVATWARALDADADILIYGCDVAATSEGRAMLQTLAALTGADVSASVDTTGAAALGGDWALEYAIGSIEAHLALSQDAQDEWFGLLATASLQPTQDTYLDQDTPTLNFGTATTLVVNPNNNHGDNALLQFDLSSLAAGSVINSAVLRMQATLVENDMNVDVHALTQAWSEGAVNGAAGAASWNERIAGTPWTTAGGTYDATRAARFDADATGQHTWDLTALVQSWLDGTRANNGIVLIGSGTTTNSHVVYASGEGATAPVLVLTYNTAPLLDAAMSPTLAVANQNAPAPYGATGTLVSSLVDFATPAGQVDNVTDSDAGAVTGIAVTAADTSTGSWWYTTNGGTTWSALGAVSATSSRLLAADANTRVYFQPGATIGTIPAALTFRAWDRTSGFNGAAADTSVNGGTTAFSIATDTAAVTIAMNAAPTLPGTPNDLAPINEDASSNAGTRVSALLSGLVADTNSQAVSGIAVTGVDNTNGTWQYTRNGGGTWNAFGAVSAGSARLLAADALTSVRFVPNANWNGAVPGGITFRAWDQTSGTAGGTADTTSASFTVRDNFSAVSYSNNDGSASWSAGWVDSDGNAAGGQIQVTGTHLQFDGGSNSTSSIYRDVNLADSSSAVLSFTFNNSVSPGAMRLEISGDGGATYTTLASSFASSGTASYDVTAYGATTTRIRFTVEGNNGLLLGLGAGGPFSVDNLQIAYTRPLNGGASAFSSATASAGITVASVNDAPRGASNTVTTLEDTAFVFNASHFGFSDTSDTPANAFSAVRIFALPSDGRLRLNGAAVTFGQLVSIASI
ncbi:MAG: repeat-containing protein, partial [Betaproteobacteria bacterium]|nr:repeat-containing protein [Betaproteobacteria bacterium]